MRTSRFAPMASPSVSFRISRSTEDLAGTLHLLSQRLLQLEQRLTVLEKREEEEPEEDPALVTSLANAERLLLDCRALLEGALEEGDASDERPSALADAKDGAAEDDQDWHTRAVA
jgi:hypothetical protein